MSDIIDEKEKLLIEFFLADKDLFIKVVRILKPEYFEAPLDRVVQFVLDYFNKYHNLPSHDVIKAETTVQLVTREVEEHEMQYLCDEIEEFCQNAAMRLAILTSVDDYLPSNDFSSIHEEIKKALMIRMDTSVGLDYYTDPDIRLMLMQQDLDARSIGWPSIDAVIDYVKRGDLFLFAAGTGAGKSLTLANISNNFSSDGLSCLYISFELKDSLIAKRMDSIVTGIDTREVFDRIEDVTAQLKRLSGKNGNIIIKKMPVGTNANEIRAYLMDYHLAFGQYPDCICADYLDLMAPNSSQGIKNGVFDRDKQITEELREIMVDTNAYGFTASQLNRDAVGTSQKDQSHIAGGLSKLNTVDGALAISRTEEQIEKGEIEFQVLKLRNASMTHYPVILYMDEKNLQITEKPNNVRIPTSSTGKKTTVSGKDRLNAILNKSKK